MAPQVIARDPEQPGDDRGASRLVACGVVNHIHEDILRDIVGPAARALRLSSPTRAVLTVALGQELAAELRLNPDHAEANAEMGTILLDRLDAANAIPYLEKAVKLDPDEWVTYRQLGKAYYMQKDYAKSETALQQAVRHDPQGLAHYQLGLVYRSLGQKEAANAQFEISRKLKLEGLAHDENQMTTLKSVEQ